MIKLTFSKILSRKYVFTLFFILSITYGTTYQQFRHFDIHDPRGVSDSKSYVSMAQGDQNVLFHHRYRFIIPSCVKILSAITGKHDTNSIILFFYIINFSISCLTAFIFYLFLKKLGFSYIISLLGIVIFLSSRILILSTGTPLVDSIYFFSIVLIVYLLLSEHFTILLLAYPFLILTKETTIPFLFLPLFFNKFNRKKNLILFTFFTTISFVMLFAYRTHINEITNSSSSLPEVFNFILKHIVENGKQLLTLRGIHDFQNGFSFFLIFGIFGYFLNKKQNYYKMPLFVKLIIPLSLFFALMSGNLGRMFFSAFVVVIPYSLIFIEHIALTFSINNPPTTSNS